MKQVVISVGNDEYTVISLGDDLKPLSAEREIGITLVAAIDKMIESGYSKELIIKIIDDAYENRL
ncbi:hypothetical protein IMAU60170_02213 [Lactiplantibacillus plantarum]|nr:hypothetical protein [Lactiplantibacillus plantarum]MCG0745347.1 hypothetical protein [Lactiplantibacillus plantarum]